MYMFHTLIDMCVLDEKWERKSKSLKELTSVSLNLTTKYHLIPSLFLLCILLRAYMASEIKRR